MNYDMKNSTEYLNKMRTEKNAEKINWNNVEGIYFVENENNEEMNYWFLVKNNRLFICSFLIGHLEGKNEIQNELNKVENILKTL